jgi:hypothetical protein
MTGLASWATGLILPLVSQKAFSQMPSLAATRQYLLASGAAGNYIEAIMTVTLNTVTSNAAYQPYVPHVSSTSAAALSSAAVSLSAQSAVVASLGGSTGASVYTPSGLLDTLRQAGTLAEPVSIPKDGSNVDTSGTAQQALDQGIVSTLASSASGSGIYTGVGTVSGFSEQVSSNWAELLKTNPDLAGTVIADSFNSGLVSLLQVTA